MKRRNRSSLHAILSSPFTLIAALVLFVVLARAAWSISGKAQESALRLEVAQTELAKLQENQADLSNRVTELSTPDGIKAQMRERYHAVEPGESVAIIVDSAASDTAAALNATSSQAISWWGRLLHVFGL